MKVCDFMSKWSDTLALAKAGYKASEIKTLLSEKESEEKEVVEHGNENNEETRTEETVTEEKTDSHNEGTEDKSKEITDWESKYHELEKELKTVQTRNLKEDISGKDNQKTVEEEGYSVLAGIWR